MHSVGSPLLWAGFLVVVLALLALDLGVFHKEDKPVPAREALGWVVVWALLALAFDGFVAWRFGGAKAGEFLAGYLIEQSLSVDNLFVFVLLFAAFRIPAHLQHRVLFWGILTALVLRGAMILAGTALLQRFHWMLYVFGAFLVFTGVKLVFHEEQEHSPEHTLAYRILRRIIPSTTELDGHAFFIRRGRGWVATPLFLCLALIEVSDVVFALDSVPAVFGVTLDPFIVFTSNIFAILGLRSLYFAIAGLLGRFEYLKYGLSLVLVFVGAKMLAARWVPISSAVSLGVIVALLGGATLFSVLRTRRLGARARSPGEPGA